MDISTDVLKYCNTAKLFLKIFEILLLLLIRCVQTLRFHLTDCIMEKFILKYAEN